MSASGPIALQNSLASAADPRRFQLKAFAATGLRHQGSGAATPGR